MNKPKDDSPFVPKDVPYRTQISPGAQKRLMEGVMQRLVVERQYSNPDYTARQLARDLGTNQRYLSAVLNLCFGTNFPRMVASYRVSEVRFLLSNPLNAQLTIEQIGQMVGFKSRQSLYTVFERETGMTPAQYRDQMLKNNHSTPSANTN